MTLEIGDKQYIPLGKYVPGSGSGSGSGDVSASGDNEFKGSNVFDKSVTFKDGIRLYKPDGSVYRDLYINGVDNLQISDTIQIGNLVLNSTEGIYDAFKADWFLTQNSITDTDTIKVTKEGKGLKLNADFTEILEKIQELELFKFPNATIQGDPVINNGQVSNFTDVDYLQFPFILDLHNKPFRIEFPFTTDEDVTTQQNILDSKFGIALAIKDGKGLMAISSNGTSWDIGTSTGIIDIQPHTTYYAKVSWNGILYRTELSVDEQSYTTDMHLAGNLKPYPTTIYIGGCNSEETGHDPHPFFGIINMNKARMFVQDQLIWQGMDDVGLATRLDRDADNITEAGIQNLKRFLGLSDIETILNEILGNTEAVTNLVYDINGEVIE